MFFVNSVYPEVTRTFSEVSTTCLPLRTAVFTGIREDNQLETYQENTENFKPTVDGKKNPPLIGPKKEINKEYKDCFLIMFIL